MRRWLLLACVMAFAPGCAVHTGAYVGPVEPVGYYGFGYGPAPVYVARPVYVRPRMYFGPRVHARPFYARRAGWRRHSRW